MMIEHEKQLYLCRLDNHPIYALNGIRYNEISLVEHLKDYHTLDFIVDKYLNIDGEYTVSNGYENLTNHMEVYLEDIGFFRIEHMSIANDGYAETKNVTAYACYKELEDKDIIGLKANQGTSDSIEMTAANNLDDLGFAKEYVTLCNENKQISCLDILLAKVPGWNIGYIDPVIKNSKVTFDVSTSNIYAILTTEIAPKLECIFDFDIRHRFVNAYHKDIIGNDTNIFISSRNLLNSVTVNTEENGIVTRLNVQGGDGLEFADVNYGLTYVDNISYRLSKEYLGTQDLVKKVKNWLDFKEQHRYEYITLSKQWAAQQSKISELMLRVPNDGDASEQWDTMEENLLHENLKYYQALITSLQISVDTSPVYITDPDNNEIYQPWLANDGTVDHQKYLNLLYQSINGYGGYYTYFEVLNYIIPNIRIAISNLGVPDDNKHDYIKDFETNWDLYGIEELKGKLLEYEQKLKSISNYSIPWSAMSEDAQAAFGQGETAYNKTHNSYVQLTGYIGSTTTPGTIKYKLAALEAELSNLQQQLNTVQTKREELTSLVMIENARWHFTDRELATVSKLFTCGDYTNNNIFTTSLNTMVTGIDVQEELYQDALKKLSHLSQPQYTFDADIDNLLALEEFKHWKLDLKNGNFIRLGIRDDYSVKLRVISIERNPCIQDSHLSLTFSNMITGMDGRSDLDHILDLESSSSRNSISVGNGASNNLQLSTDILNLIIGSNNFGSKISNIITDATLDNVYIQAAIADYMRITTLDVTRITGNEASFNKFFSDYLDVDYLVANSGTIKLLNSDVANIKNAMIGVAGVETGLFFNLNASNTKLDQAYIINGIAANMSIANLKVSDITISDQMRILSENGNLRMDGSTMQFLDKDNKVGIQIGYGNNENPSIIIRDDDGAVVLTSQGITENAIADDLIKTPMIADGQITEDKVSFHIETDEDGTVITSIENIYNGDGGKFGIEYTQFKEHTSNSLGELEDKIDESLVYNIEIHSTNGNIFKNGQVATMLSCHVFKSNIEITDDLNAAAFHWFKKNHDGTPDDVWNAAHFGGSKTVAITQEDVTGCATFECHVDGAPTI